MDDKRNARHKTSCRELELYQRGVAWNRTEVGSRLDLDLTFLQHCKISDQQDQSWVSE